MTKVQLTLTDQEAAILTGYGEQFGYNLTKVTKFFISKATEKIAKAGTMPVYPMSQTTEEQGEAALAQYQKGQTIKVENAADFFGQL